MSYPHVSVLLNEVVECFSANQIKTFVDGTLGAGGHSEAILRNHAEIQTLVGIDQDLFALEIAKKRLLPWKEKVCFAHGNFSEMEKVLKQRSISQVDGILLDLGVSSMQLDKAEKGFSFSKEGPLDMRMNQDQKLSALEIVNTWPEKELGRIFRDYGEEKRWRSAASAVVKARGIKPIKTTFELVEVLKPIFPWKKKGINPLTLIFQALRIAVNSELDVLEKVLPIAIDLLAPKGRLAVISFHSLEDRIVKNAMRFAASDKMNTEGFGGVFLDKKPLVKIITKKAVTATEEEVKENPRSRSASFRIVEKL